MRMHRAWCLAGAVLAIAVLVLGALSTGAWGQQQSTVERAIPAGRADPAQPDHHAHFVKCAKVCAECAVHCDSNFQHCADIVSTSPKKEHTKSMKLSADCAEACRLAATLAGRESQFAVGACDFCARCCDECASACEAVATDKHMAECAKACRDCAKACREMVKMVK